MISVWALAAFSSASAWAAGPGPGPNYQLIPEGANSGVVVTNNGKAQVNWWNWFDQPSGKYYWVSCHENCH